jgi:hypothetical protein
MHLEGISLRDVEVMLAVARLESGGSLVEPIEQEILLSTTAMVLLTLQIVGVQPRPAGVRAHHVEVFFGGA